MNYFIVRNGQQAGPFAVDQLIAEGVTPTTLVWCEGMAQWQPAQEIAEISVLFYQQPQQPVVPPTPEQAYQQPQPAYQQPQQPQPQQAYQQPQQAYQQPQQPQQPQQAYQQPVYGPQPAYGNQQMPMPQNYLIHSIIVTILCCWPLGIVAIINAVGVGNAYNAGNYEEAERKSKQAKKWCIWSAVSAAILLALYFAVMFIAYMADTF